MIPDIKFAPVAPPPFRGGAAPKGIGAAVSAGPQDQVQLGQASHAPEASASVAPAFKSGLLYIVDHFEIPGSMSVPGPFALVEHFVQGGTSHGQAVAQAAREQGFSGPMMGMECSPQPSEQLLPYIGVWMRSDDPQMLSMALNERLLDSRVQGLTNMDQALQRVLDDYPTNSVINLSQGSGQSNLVHLCVELMMPDEADRGITKEDARAERRRVALALGVDAEKFCGDDREERIKVWPAVVQGLLDRAAATDADPRVRLAQAAYDQTVMTLASLGNTVVVAAGNEQELPTSLEESFANGGKFRFSPNFIGNDYVNSETLAVGALDQGKVADYSSRLPSVLIYANGQLGEEQGTSLAAPRVAAVLADLKTRGSNWAEQMQHYCTKQEVDSQPVFFLRS